MLLDLYLLHTGLKQAVVSLLYMVDYLFTSNLDHSCFVCHSDHHFTSVRTEGDGKVNQLKVLS